MLIIIYFVDLGENGKNKNDKKIIIKKRRS